MAIDLPAAVVEALRSGTPFAETRVAIASRSDEPAWASDACWLFYTPVQWGGRRGGVGHISACRGGISACRGSRRDMRL